jgi:hypothetical protein
VWLVLAVLASCWLVGLGSQAAAQDPEAGLAEAEARAAAAKVEIQHFEAAVKPARSRFHAAAMDAGPVRSRLQDAAARVASIESSLRREHRQAVASVQRIAEERDEASEEHDQTVRAKVGLAIAALVLAALAFAWGWFRASAAVAFLVRLELGQAVGLCVGAGLIAVIVGSVAGSAEGILGAIGYAVVALGFTLPVVFAVARHSAEVQRGRANPHLRRDRMPARVTQGVAGLFAALFLLALGTAVFAGEAKSGDASAELRAQAEGRTLSSPALLAAESKAHKLEQEAGAKLAVVHRRRADLRASQRQLNHAQRRLAIAEGAERRFTSRLVAIEKRELREQERQEREAQKQAEAEEREYEEATQEEEEEELAAEECDPNYSGCLDPNAADYDCEGGSGDGPDYTGTVEVTGVDHYGLDEDGDGIGCDP